MELSTVEQTTDDVNRLKYTRDIKEMRVIHADLAKLVKCVIGLAYHVGTCNKGEVLRFYVDDGKHYEFTKADLRAASAKVDRKIKKLNRYWKFSRKKRNTTTSEGPSGLKGIYAPIFAGNPLLHYFSVPKNFGPLDPAEWKETGVMGPLLMDSLPYVSQGYMLRNTLTMLFFLYARTMNLQEPETGSFSHFDSVMEQAFAKMPATFYKGNGKKDEKMLMSKALEDKVIDKELTTQDVIRITRPDFYAEDTPLFKLSKNVTEEDQIYRKSFNNYYFQLLATLNYYSKQNLEESGDEKLLQVLGALNAKEHTDKMVEEHNIVKETARRWNEYLEPIQKAQRDKRMKELAARKKAAVAK